APSRPRGWSRRWSRRSRRRPRGADPHRCALHRSKHRRSAGGSMAVATILEFPGVTREQYEAAGGAGLTPSRDRVAHEFDLVPGFLQRDEHLLAADARAAVVPLGMDDQRRLVARWLQVEG